MPIIILSATLERRFGGVEDMHLLKGYSSIDDLVTALRSFEAKRRGKPVVVDARDFFYSRINMAMGDDVVLEILDGEGTWQYVNETCARVLEKPSKGDRWVWNVLAFPITLHTRETGVVLTARALERKSVL